LLKYEAAGVNLVMAARKDIDANVEIRQDNHPLPPDHATKDTQFPDGQSIIHIDKPRMYQIVDNRSFGPHTPELVIRTPGVALFAFTFTSCVAP
jgi:hypothetical protein